MPPSCPLCEAPVPAEVQAGPPEAVFTCSGCYISLTWKNGTVMPTPRASAPSALPRASSPNLAPLPGLPSAPRSVTGPIPRPRASVPIAETPAWGSDATAVERPAPQWNDSTSVDDGALGRIHPESTLVEVPAVTGAAPTAPPPQAGYPAWLDEKTNAAPPAQAPPARIPASTQALFSPFSIPQAPGGLPELPRARATTGAFPAPPPSSPGGLKPIPRGTTGAFPAFSAPPGSELKALPRGNTGAFPAVQPSDLPPLPRAPTGAFPAVKPKSTTGAFPAARPSSPTMPASALPLNAGSLEAPRSSAPTTPFVPLSSPPQAQTIRVPSYGDLMAVDTAPSPEARPALVVAPGTLDTPELGSADTSISQALSAPRPSTPAGKAIGRIALAKAPAPSPAPSPTAGNATYPALLPVGDAPLPETRNDHRGDVATQREAEAAPAAETKADLVAVRAALGDGESAPTSQAEALVPDAPSAESDLPPPEPTPPPPGAVTMRGTPPVAPPRVKRSTASVGQGALIAIIAVPLGLILVGGGGWYWYTHRTPDVVEIPLPPEKPLRPQPPPDEAPVAKPEPPPPPVEPPKPVEPTKTVRMVGKFAVVLETDDTPNAAAKKAAELFKKGNALLAKKDKKGAIAAYRASLKAYPGYVASERALGSALAANKDPKGAVKMLNQYLEHVPDAPDAAVVKKWVEKLKKKKK